MSTSSLRNAIRAALYAMADSDLAVVSTDLLSALGYQSDRTLPDQSGDPVNFTRQFKAANSGTQSEQTFLNNADAVHILFQFTGGEIQAETQSALFDAAGFDQGNARSFLFAAVQLHGDNYARGQYAAFTRELNKRFPMPMVVLFRTASNCVSLAFVHRRPNKRDPERDVLGNVSLIREINSTDPHRAHLDILAELSLPTRLRWMNDHGKARNFDSLLEAWLASLNTEELNKRFYRELYVWFERALTTAYFPTRQAKTLRKEEHVIRLITRLMFVWFIKEKGLVSEDLFIEEQVRSLLKDYDRTGGDSYYRAVLQNLFFATLNTEIEQRRFSRANRDDHRNFSLYRYSDEIADPNRLLRLFNQTPFINGGLFDCLDSFDASGAGGIRVDCFTDNPKHRAGYSIPNCLFFGDGANPGLIDLFNRYKFTVEENTPTEQEVALDPELLGKVFENLLAAVNPETQLSARKSTGSYYTPRAVVDYMVDEALVATLAQKTVLEDGDADRYQARLRYLLDYGDAFADAETLFTPSERERIVRAIADLKVIDPAVGSGAFPMGVLHKLTLALRRLDDRNQHWESLQKELAGQRAAATFDTHDPEARESELAEISRTFEKYRASDFGRKLYLIQNSIYGVDIQPIATQIAKLRFFISLAIEQQPNNTPTDNYGIRPLPNLETRFVAADTLMPLDKPTQRTLGETGEVQRLEAELAANRERHFHANTRAAKLACRSQDAILRQQLSAALQIAGFPAVSAAQLAAWDPFDQNADRAGWFDAEYMFGMAGGFDVVIANPPYINVENLTEERKEFLFTHYQTSEGRTDIYIAFLEKSLSLLSDTGMMCYIIPKAFTTQQYATKMRKRLINEHHIRELVDASSYRIFENAVVYNVVISVANRKSPVPTVVRRHHSNADFASRTGEELTIDQDFFATLKDARLDTNPPDTVAIAIKEKAWRKAVRFDQICLVAYGARLNYRTKGKKVGKAHYIRTIKAAGTKPFCEGENIERYSFSQNGWLNYKPDEHYNPMFPELFENDKLMCIRIVKDLLRFAYDDQGFYNSHTVINCVRLDLLAGAKHRTAVKAVKAADLAVAKRFDYRFLLAVLNSQFTIWYFLNFLADGLNFYPNDAKQLPIPKADAAEQRPIVELANRIMKAKTANPSADTSADEAEIDRLVYELYGLTDAEIAVVAGRREEVEQLADEWEQNRPRGVDVVAMAEHPAYQRIIEIGVAAVPWLLSRLEQRPNHWFLALNAITGSNPVPSESQGNVKAMADAWIKWGWENGYRW